MNKREISHWTLSIWDKLSKLDFSHIDFYCGVRYRDGLILLLEKHKKSYSVPLEGLPIGYQLKYYNDHLKKNERRGFFNNEY